MDLPDHDDPVDHQRTAARHPERHVEHRPVLGDVDVLAAEHRVPALRHAALTGQFGQQADRVPADPVLRVVEIKPAGLGDQVGAARGIVGEEIPQGEFTYVGVVALEGLERC